MLLSGSMLRAIPNKRIQHTLREANQCVDELVGMGPSVLTSSAIFFEPLHVVDRLLAYDKANTFCNRLVNY